MIGRTLGSADRGPDAPRQPARREARAQRPASLPERQRRHLTLLIAGYRYEEIVRLTGATYTNVNKHLTRARASIRGAQAA